MSDGELLLLGLSSLLGAVGVASLILDRLHPRSGTPFRWSEREHQNALIMSQYYAKFGPPA